MYGMIRVKGLSQKYKQMTKKVTWGRKGVSKTTYNKRIAKNHLDQTI